MMNPYPDHHVRRCPLCERFTGQRKLPLLIHVEPTHFVVLNYTCRYCKHCDLLVADKLRIERLLCELFSLMDPQAIGNDYMVLGTVEKEAWREGVANPKSTAEMLPHAHDFNKDYCELRITQAGWFHINQEPPIRKPPPSQEWVKARLN